MRRSSVRFAFLLSVSALAVAGCGQQASTPTASGTPIGAAAADAEAQAAAEAKAAELAAKEQELTEREAALQQQQLDAEQAKQQAVAAAAQKTAASKPAAKPATGTSSTTKTPAPPPAPIMVPVGTELAVALSQNVNTKKVLVGAPVEGTLASDLVVGGRRAAKTGAAVHGSVTQVVSGSDKIGGVPTIGLRFDTLVAADGSTKTINASYVQQAKSETGKDTAKIVGGAAAGAIIGHQVDDDKGTVIGGLLGAGAGAAAAQKTGVDIKLTAGQVLTVATTSPFEVKP
jgi:Glycine zipper 2TM domain